MKERKRQKKEMFKENPSSKYYSWKFENFILL